MKYFIEKINNSILFYLIEPNEKRNFIFEASNGFLVSSSDFPDLSNNEIKLAGDDESKDKRLVVKKDFPIYTNIDLYLSNVKQALEEWESTLPNHDNIYTDETLLTKIRIFGQEFLVPSDRKYIAIDLEGDLCAYRTKPVDGKETWNENGNTPLYLIFELGQKYTNWRKSLRPITDFIVK